MSRNSLFVLVFSYFFVFSCYEISLANQLRWWEKDAEGWFFYKEHPQPKEKEKKAPPHVDESVKETEKEPLPEPKRKLFTDILNEEGKRLLSEAIENPTVENVRRYMEFNKLAYEISEDFALTWQKVLMQYPHLNPERPVNDNLLRDYFEQDYKKQDKVLRELAKRSGLFYFYSSTCEFCVRQNEFIKRFKANHPYFAIKSISIDGVVLPDLPDSVADNGISQYLGIQMVPTIFIVTPPDNFQMLYAGVITDDDMKKALLYFATEVPSNRKQQLDNVLLTPIGKSEIIAPTKR